MFRYDTSILTDEHPPDRQRNDLPHTAHSSIALYQQSLRGRSGIEQTGNVNVIPVPGMIADAALHAWTYAAQVPGTTAAAVVRPGTWWVRAEHETSTRSTFKISRGLFGSSTPLNELLL